MQQLARSLNTRASVVFVSGMDFELLVYHREGSCFALTSSPFRFGIQSTWFSALLSLPLSLFPCLRVEAGVCLCLSCSAYCRERPLSRQRGFQPPPGRTWLSEPPGSVRTSWFGIFPCSVHIAMRVKQTRVTCYTKYAWISLAPTSSKRARTFFPCTRSDSSSRMHPNFLPSADEKAAAGKQAAYSSKNPE